MKEKIHPPYQDVLFVDSSTGTKFLIGSSYQTKKTEEFEGKTYPVCTVAVSSASHPFFTGSNQFIDSEGRVDKFTKKYQKKLAQNLAVQKKQQQKEEEAAKEKASRKKTKKKK